MDNLHVAQSNSLSRYLPPLWPPIWPPLPLASGPEAELARRLTGVSSSSKSSANLRQQAAPPGVSQATADAAELASTPEPAPSALYTDQLRQQGTPPANDFAVPLIDQQRAQTQWLNAQAVVGG
jgi:hypothetical protein